MIGTMVGQTKKGSTHNGKWTAWWVRPDRLDAGQWEQKAWQETTGEGHKEQEQESKREQSKTFSNSGG